MMTEFSPFPKIPRLSRDMVITEKIDGTNAQVYIDFVIPEDTQLVRDLEFQRSFSLGVGDGLSVYAGSRSKFITPKEDNYGFARWVQSNYGKLIELLGPGQHFGEWWGNGIQRGYGMKEKKFSLFNTKRWGLIKDQSNGLVDVVPLLYYGEFDTTTIAEVLKSLEKNGSSAASGFMDPEGIVIYHTASEVMFKKTIKNDHKPKFS